MAGLINSDLLRNPQTPLSRITAQPAPAQAAPAPYKGSVAGTSQALTATPDWDAWANTPWSQPAAPAAAPKPATPAPNAGAYYDEAGSYHPGTPVPGSGGSGGSYDEAGNYHPGFGEGSYDESGSWHPPKEAPTYATPDQWAFEGANAQHAAPPDWDQWAQTPWSDAEKNAPTQKAAGAITGGIKNIVNDITGSLPGAGGTDWESWAKSPWWPGENEKPTVRGVLEDPGPVEEAYEDAKDKFYTPGDEKTQKWIDLLGGRKPLGEPDLDAWYDREWKRAQGSLNAQAAARGQSGATDTMRMLHQSRESLAADQAKESAEFMQKSFEDDTERYKLAAGLQGEVSAQDLEELDSWMRAANMAQQGEEGRVGMQIDDLMKGFNAAFSGVIKGWDDLLDADKELIQQIVMAGPAPATERANQEAKLSEGGKAALAQILKLQAGGVA